MRIRTAKALAQRIDLAYFKRAHGLRRWRIVLSVIAPLAALVWVAAHLAAGSRTPYSAGPVSRAHAFAEQRCELCHAAANGLRAHVTPRACLACHDAPRHTASLPDRVGCTGCHQEHAGRGELARVDDRFCVGCHGRLQTSQRPPSIVSSIGGFPSNHPEFAVVRGAPRDPGGLVFSHAAHVAEEGIRGPQGLERLGCESCHRPEIARTLGRRRIVTGLMTRASYADACARCHPIYFDELVEARAPHDRPEVVRAFVRDALTTYIAAHPEDIGRTTAGVRRVPLNFPRPPQ